VSFHRREAVAVRDSIEERGHSNRIRASTKAKVRDGQTGGSGDLQIHVLALNHVLRNAFLFRLRLERGFKFLDTAISPHRGHQRAHFGIRLDHILLVEVVQTERELDGGVKLEIGDGHRVTHKVSAFVSSFLVLHQPQLELLHPIRQARTRLLLQQLIHQILA